MRLNHNFTLWVYIKTNLIEKLRRFLVARAYSDVLYSVKGGKANSVRWEVLDSGVVENGTASKNLAITIGPVQGCTATTPAILDATEAANGRLMRCPD